MTAENSKIKTIFQDIRFKVNKRSHLKPIDEWPVGGKERRDQRFGGIFQEATGRSLKNHTLPDN